jgi:hypothetical protein
LGGVIEAKSVPEIKARLTKVLKEIDATFRGSPVDKIAVLEARRDELVWVLGDRRCLNGTKNHA